MSRVSICFVIVKWHAGSGRGWGLNGKKRGRVTTRRWVEARWREWEKGNVASSWWVLWAIWEHRNKVVFDEVEVEPDRIVRRVCDVMSEGVGDMGSEREGRRMERQNRGERDDGGWAAAPEGYVKVNVDAGVKESEGVSTGFVLRGRSRTCFVGWRDCMGSTKWEPCMAEASGVLDGLQAARDRGHRCLVVESDCLQVVDTLRERKQGRSIFSQVRDDISDLCFEFDSVLWSYTPRVNNCVAYALAHITPRVVGSSFWSNVLPTVANNAVIFDLSLLS
ncbi:uncharacterized protein LOC141589718 [Silene latifolia]|uniref:uncharacterized protein LOC141589718 n=1 Tax=Silene latifolia TaxID=37657 RepID=UPI003D77C092